jgi:hypothetical protein
MKIISLSIPENVITGEKAVNATIRKDDNTIVNISVTDDHPSFLKVIKAVESFKKGLISAEKLADEVYRGSSLVEKASQNFKKIDLLDGRVTISNSKIFIDGDPIDPALEGHILRMLQEDGTPKNARDWASFGKFIENLYLNTSDFVRKQLFGWLSYENLNGRGFTLTDDGCFIGYKGTGGTPDAPLSVNSGHAIVDGVEYNNSRIPNPIGSTIEMPRSEVTDDPAVGCAAGLHVGTYSYAKGWSRGVLLTVKVNPRDVVSVPTDCAAQKIRTCRYKVIDTTEVPIEKLTFTTKTQDFDSEFAEDDGVEFDYVDRYGNRTHRTVIVDEVYPDYFIGTDGDKIRTFNYDGISNLKVLDGESDSSVEDEVAFEDDEDVIGFLSSYRDYEFHISYESHSGVRERNVVLVKLDKANKLAVFRDVNNGETRSIKFSNIRSIDVVDEDDSLNDLNELRKVLEHVRKTGETFRFIYENLVGVKSQKDVRVEEVNEDYFFGIDLYLDAPRTFKISQVKEVLISVPVYNPEDSVSSEEDDFIARYGDGTDPWQDASLR